MGYTRTPWNTVVVSLDKKRGGYHTVMFNEQSKYIGRTDRLAVGIEIFKDVNEASRAADKLAKQTKSVRLGI